MHIVVIVICVILFIMALGAQKAFKDETGVDPPSRRQWTRMKRRGRASGLSDERILTRYVNRKNRQNGG